MIYNWTYFHPAREKEWKGVYQLIKRMMITKKYIFWAYYLLLGGTEKD